jgi:hypothetical protein
VLLLPVLMVGWAAPTNMHAHQSQTPSPLLFFFFPYDSSMT